MKSKHIINKEFVLTAVAICKNYRSQNQVDHFLTEIRMSGWVNFFSKTLFIASKLQVHWLTYNVFWYAALPIKGKVSWMMNNPFLYAASIGTCRCTRIFI